MYIGEGVESSHHLIMVVRRHCAGCSWASQSLIFVSCKAIMLFVLRSRSIDSILFISLIREALIEI